MRLDVLFVFGCLALSCFLFGCPARAQVQFLTAQERTIEKRLGEYYKSLDILKRDAHTVNASVRAQQKARLCSFFADDFEIYQVWNLVNFTLTGKQEACDFLEWAALNVYQSYSQHTAKHIRVYLGNERPRPRTARLEANLHEYGRSIPVGENVLQFTSIEGELMQLWTYDTSDDLWKIKRIEEAGDLLISYKVPAGSNSGPANVEILYSRYPLAAPYPGPLTTGTQP
jgi:hypothetical protein